jgi:hypothetical protein
MTLPIWEIGNDYYAKTHFDLPQASAGPNFQAIIIS